MLSFGFVVERQQAYSVQGSGITAAPGRATAVGPPVVGRLSVKSVASARGAELGLWVGQAPAQVRDLKGTLEREKAAMGIFVTLEEPTREIKLEATTAGMYRVWERDYPKIQIVSIRELLEEGQKPALPPLVLPTLQQAERVKERGGEQMTLGEAMER